MSLNLLPKRIESGPENMASDWWIFMESGKLGLPVFRHYGWSGPAISFGYGQDWNWVCKEAGGSSAGMVRRPTGGGIVRHGRDWTYSLALPKAHPSSSVPALELYESIHLAMARALEEQGLPSSLMPCPQSKRRGIPGDCFSEPVARDLMNEDGSMSRLPELVAFAQLHNLKIGTIADLIAWRRKNDRFME